MTLASSDFASSIQRLIYQLVRDCELCDQMCLAQLGVTVSQGYTLLALPHTDAVSMNELSEAMGLANSTMTRMVDQLVRKGLAHRKSDDEDRRIVRVRLTARGQEVQHTLEEALHDFFTQALGEIREDERPAVLGALERITRLVSRGLKACCAG